MKKLIIFFSVLFLIDTVHAQALKSVKLDTLVTVSLPANYYKRDTLGQQIFSATTDLGYMMAIREANAVGNPPLKKEKDLNSVMKRYVSGIQAQSQGSAQFVRDTTVGTLKAKAFTLLSKDANGDNQYRDFVLIYTQDAIYTFEYGFPESRKDLINSEAKSFFSSIRLSPELQRNDQYTDLSKATGLRTNYIIMISGGILVTLAIVWLVFRKKNSNVELV